MNPHELLLLIAGDLARRGQVVPQLSAPQAVPTAERLLRVLGIVPEPPRALPQRPAWDDRTRLLATIDEVQQGRSR